MFVVYVVCVLLNRITCPTYVCVCAHMHVCMCACAHVCMYACMHVCMCACMHVCMYACMHDLVLCSSCGLLCIHLAALIMFVSIYIYIYICVALRCIVLRFNVAKRFAGHWPLVFPAKARHRVARYLRLQNTLRKPEADECGRIAADAADCERTASILASAIQVSVKKHSSGE